MIGGVFMTLIVTGAFHIFPLSFGCCQLFYAVYVGVRRRIAIHRARSAMAPLKKGYDEVWNVVKAQQQSELLFLEQVAGAHECWRHLQPFQDLDILVS